MVRRNNTLSLVVGAVAAFFIISFMFSGGSGRVDREDSYGLSDVGSGRDTVPETTHPDLEHLGGVLTGGAIAPKLGNETAKRELGRASWKLLHTMMARFPEEPTADDSLALKTYIQLFARLYPCGECAAHFQLLLKDFPPQTSSRNAAAGWACHVHNQVNERLKKDIFDCSKIGDFYDCGCAEEDGKGKADEKEVPL
jgi:FAD-linked sulfhydryl oxidase